MSWKNKPRGIKLCEVCAQRGVTKKADFFFIVLVGSLGIQPQVRVNSKSIGLCDACCNSNTDERWEATKRLIGFIAFERRGFLKKSIRDRKSVPAEKRA